MAATLFTDIIRQAEASGIINTRSQDARDWYREKAQSVTTKPSLIVAQSADRFTSMPRIGKMYMFYYDPKHKDTLPYYDRFPLVFPIGIDSNGILGMNLHYLGHVYRARLMDALYDLTNNKKMDESTKLRISYDVLNAAAKYKYFKPTIKRYLPGHIKSRFIEVHSNEWDMALMLPLEQFKGASKSKVWEDSRKSITRW